jgi:hypothetical protein
LSEWAQKFQRFNSLLENISEINEKNKGELRAQC